jgi:hypothetical protein
MALKTRARIFVLGEEFALIPPETGLDAALRRAEVIGSAEKR